MCSLHVLTHCSPQSMACNCVPWPHVSVTRCSIGRSQRSHSNVLLHLLFRCTIQGIPIGSLHFRETETTVCFCLIVYLLGTQSYQPPFKSSWPRSTDPVMGCLVPSLSKQINGDDCILYAIANMFEICQHGYDNVPEGELIWEFQPDDLKFRSHLISCFSSGNFSSFFREKIRRLPRKSFLPHM